jgi:hypothetical protein
MTHGERSSTARKRLHVASHAPVLAGQRIPGFGALSPAVMFASTER